MIVVIIYILSLIIVAMVLIFFDIFFWELSITAINHIKYHPHNIAGYSAVLQSNKGDIIQLLGNWGTSANFSLSINQNMRRLELKPFESAVLYEEMRVIPPSDESPIRQYVPKISHRINLDSIDHDEKPGFVQQAQEFMNLFKENNTRIGATINDAYETIKLCESLVQYS
jgi:hypothetical protein